MVNFIERDWRDDDIQFADGSLPCRWLDTLSEEAENGFPVSTPLHKEGFAMMDGEQAEALRKWLKSKLGDKKITCPVCGSDEMRPGAILAPPVYVRDQGATMSGTWRSPGNRAELYCHNCTYSMLFDPRLIPGFPLKGRHDA